MPSPISVIVITCNEESNIRDCLDSLTALDYPPELHEIIVVDASTDGTARIVGGYPGVRLVRSEKSFSGQKNAGLRQAAFGILAFTDADCLVPPNWLKVIDDAFCDERVSAIGGNAFPPPRTARFGRWAACMGHPAGGAIGFDANVSEGERGISFVPGCNSAFRKSALLEGAGFDPAFFEGGEDVDISRRLRKKGRILRYVPELTVYHKPRSNLLSYFQWNIRVGATKYSLQRPSLARLILQPSFPLWPVAALLGIVGLGAAGREGLALLVSAGLWLSLIGALLVFAKPFRMLLARRRKIGVSLAAVTIAVPALVCLRQVGINIGELGKRRRVRKSEKARREKQD